MAPADLVEIARGLSAIEVKVGLYPEGALKQVGR
jgi:hypothetical protein